MHSSIRSTRALLAVGRLGWAVFSGVACVRYGRARPGGGNGDPLDWFLPDPEVVKLRVSGKAARGGRGAHLRGRLSLRAGVVPHTARRDRRVPRPRLPSRSSQV
jgi:hypothetical protein